MRNSKFLFSFKWFLYFQCLQLRKKTTRLIKEKDEAIKRAHEQYEKELKYNLDILRRQKNILIVERGEHLEIDSKVLAAEEGIKRLLDRLKKSLDTR